MADCSSSAVDANARSRVTGVSVAVAFAALAVGEVPVARLALVALPTVRVRSALALAGCGVAEVVQGTDRVAVARCSIITQQDVAKIVKLLPQGNGVFISSGQGTVQRCWY